MSSVTDINRIAKHVFSEPKFVAQAQYWSECPSPASQILAAVGRDAAASYVTGGGWPDDLAQQAVRIDWFEPIDFDWWEPRHDAPWRRQDARNRGESA